MTETRPLFPLGAPRVSAPPWHPLRPAPAPPPSTRAQVPESTDDNGELTQAKEAAAKAEAALETASNELAVLREKHQELERALGDLLRDGVRVAEASLRLSLVDAVALVREAATQVVEAELRLDPTVIERFVQAGLDRVGAEARVQVACGAALFELLHEPSFAPVRQRHTLVCCESLAPLGCEVRSGKDSFAVGVDARLVSLAASLEGEEP
jgi:hypothetical protein